MSGGRCARPTSPDSVPTDQIANKLSEYGPLTITCLGISLTHHSPSPKLPDPESYVNPPVPDPKQSGPPPQLPAGYGRWREYKYDPNAVVVPAPAWTEGGSLQGWRAGGFLSGHARRDHRDRDGGGGGDDGGRRGGWVKDLSTILCFRCNQYGHFANQCPNDAVPGDRGGLRGGGSGGR